MKLRRDYKGYKWCVVVEAGEVASIGFIAPFRTRQLAREYMHWYYNRMSWDDYVKRILNDPR